jgi:hypothetical protein
MPCGSCNNRRSSETSVITKATQRNTPQDGVLHSHRRENLKSYIALTGLILQRGSKVFPARYGMGFYIPEDGILHSYSRENLKSYKLHLLFVESKVYLAVQVENIYIPRDIKPTHINWIRDNVKYDNKQTRDVY